MIPGDPFSVALVVVAPCTFHMNWKQRVFEPCQSSPPLVLELLVLIMFLFQCEEEDKAPLKGTAGCRA